VPQAAHLRCRLQEPNGRSARTLVQRRLTKRSLEEEVFSEAPMQDPALNPPRRGRRHLFVASPPIPQPKYLEVVYENAVSPLHSIPSDALRAVLPISSI
jgi:hypothetical protein